MKQGTKPGLIVGIILMLPAIFISLAAIQHALRTTVTCEQACHNLNTSYVACDDDVCFCQSNSSIEPLHIRTIANGSGEQISVECGP